MITPTDTSKRLSDENVRSYLAQASASIKGNGSLTIKGAAPTIVLLCDHIAALTAPPSQDKVERARELLAEACTAEHLPLLAAWLRKGSVIEKPIAVAALRAITQALCESEAITACSNQRFDTVTESSGAAAMREVAAKANEKSANEIRTISKQIGGVTSKRGEEAAQLLEAAAIEIRALPLPVSADGRDAVIGEEGEIYTAERLKELLDDRDAFLVAKGLFSEYAAQIKSKQPSDTGAENDRTRKT